jgi:hypothetical protein
MSESAKISVRHYQALCGLALAAVFLLQMQQNVSVFFNAALFAVGAVSTLFRFRVSPAWVLLVLAITHIFEQQHPRQIFQTDLRAAPPLDLTSVLLCMAMLTYTIGQYRLQALRFGVPTGQPQPRSEETLSLAELAALMLSAPVCALAAEGAALLLRQHWELVGLPPRWKQLLALVWVVIVGMFIAAHVFRYWRRARMTRDLALMALQDDLWNEPRGEQRRIGRWDEWRKLRGW